MEKHKDFFGNELNEGDMVASLLKGYRSLVLAKIIAITPKKVKVLYKTHGDWDQTYLVDPETVIKKHETTK